MKNTKLWCTVDALGVIFAIHLSESEILSREKYFHSYKIFKYQVIPAVLKQEKVGVQIKKWKDVVNTGWLLLNQFSQNYPPFPTIFSDPSLNCIKTLVHTYICLNIWV